jgi:cell division protein FtsW
MTAFTFIDYRKLAGIALPTCILCFILLLLIHIPGLGHGAGGAKRWLNLYLFRIQPSEFFKLSYLLFLAWCFTKFRSNEKKLTQVILPNLGFLILACTVIQKQPDLSTAMLVAGTAFIMLSIYSNKPGIMIGILAAGILSAVTLILTTPYRFRRLLAFLNPWEDRLGSGYQIIQSLLSLGSGGFLGRGLGESRQKFFYLPEEHTDFIFAVIGEEFGFIGTFLVIATFWVLMWRGIRIAIKAKDDFGRYLALGITTMICIQALLNLSVVTGIVPPTGVPLPFVSYGGSSLITNLLAIGILLNISRQNI